VRTPLARSRPLAARARLALLAAALIGAPLVAGCDASEDADLERGRALFIQNCGTCHTLAQAGTGANIGPDLDAAFARARADGMDSDTIEGVTQQQIANPRDIDLPEGTPEYTAVYMPPEIVTGQDAEDVAAYVGDVAGVAGAKPPPLGPPEQIFAERCGTCHSLEAGAGDGVGPNLADSLAGQDAAYIRQQIVEPNSKIAKGFQPDVMPQDFEQSIPGENLDKLVDYILLQVGQRGG
jgi:mono/diheme cytochrome c family protein